MERIALTGRHSRYDEIEFGATWEAMVANADSFPSAKTTVGLGRKFAWNQWARVNKITDESGKIIADPAVLREKADELQAAQGGGNALDGREC